MTPGRSQRLERDLAEIGAMGRASCLERWSAVFGRSPPKHLSLPFLRRVLMWDAQTKTLGGVSGGTARRLKQVAAGKPPAPAIKPGSHLVREWNGRSYHVEVTEAGFVMEGRTWRSLSAVARHITGAHWSGPRFFGTQ